MRKVLYILGELDDLDLQWLVDAGSLRGVAAGTEIIQRGGGVDSLIVVLDGYLLVQHRGVDLARLGPGEVVGEISLLDSRPPVAEVTAATDAQLFEVPFALLHNKLAADTGFAARFYRALGQFLANRLSRATHWIGAGATSTNLPTDERDDAPIGPEALQAVALAGARFDWFLQRARGQAQDA